MLLYVPPSSAHAGGVHGYTPTAGRQLLSPFFELHRLHGILAVPAPQEHALLPSSPSESSDDDGTAACVACSPPDSLPTTLLLS